LVVRDADFAADFASIRIVRTTVFIDEQRVPLELEFDDRDALCRHVLAIDHGAPIGTARLDLDYGGKVGRLAVLRNHRRHGVGRALMERLHAIAREHGAATLWCHAQLTAVPFYERLGYRSLGSTFDEAGIDHVRMELALA
jgi:predicted GNAT family N-acyltransferase